jgi:hypothetical protein
MRRIAFILFTALIQTITANAQSLYAYVGGGIGYDLFMRNKQATVYKTQGPILLSPQFVTGLRYYTAQRFNIMFDATLGASRFNMPTKRNDVRKFYYEQIRSFVTLGSGFYVEIDEEQSFMPYLQLGAAYYEFSDMTEKVPNGYVGVQSDYNSACIVAVCGAGFEYGFRLVARSSINVRALYTPTDIFPEPVKYGLDGINKNGPYALQGKLLQFLVTYQVSIPVIKERYY